MRIAIVLFHPLSESLGTMSTTFNVIKWLKRLRDDLDVLLLTPFSGQNGELNISVYKLSTRIPVFRSELYRLFRFFYWNTPWVIKYVFLDKRTLKRLIKSIAIGLTRILKKLDVDLLYGVQEFSVLACIWAKDMARRHDLPVVADIRNYYPEECVDLGLVRREDSWYQIVRRFCDNAVRLADIVLVPNEFARRFLIRRCDLEQKRVQVLRRGAELFLNENNIPNREPPLLVYSGSFGKIANLNMLYKSLLIVSIRRDVKVAITGRGIYLGKLRELMKHPNVDIKFAWLPSKRAFYSFLSRCYMGLIPWSKSISRAFGFPSKLCDYMSVGLPFVATDVGGWTEDLKGKDLGVFVHDNSLSFAEGILELLNDPDRAVKYALNIIRFVRKEFNWRKSVSELIKLLRSLI